MKMHWSDCAIHNAPALPVGPCDCGGLELALDVAHGSIASFISGARSEGPLLGNQGAGSLVQPQCFPPDGLIADAAAGDLPDAHDSVVFFGGSDGVDLNVADIPVVLELKNEP